MSRVVQVSEARFDELVDVALDGVPDGLAELVTNLAVLVADVDDDDPELLGLYDGVPLTEATGDTVALGPDRIFVFRRPLCEMCETEEELTEEVRITVVHEIAHHFGISEERLHELGYE